jgi:hypothetical protein
MSRPASSEPEDPRHIAHVFGDAPAGTIADEDLVSAGNTWDQLDTTTVEDWQMLFARTYANKRGMA